MVHVIENSSFPLLLHGLRTSCLSALREITLLKIRIYNFRNQSGMCKLRKRWYETRVFLPSIPDAVLCANKFNMKVWKIIIYDKYNFVLNIMILQFHCVNLYIVTYNCVQFINISLSFRNIMRLLSVFLHWENHIDLSILNEYIISVSGISFHHHLNRNCHSEIDIFINHSKDWKQNNRVNWSFTTTYEKICLYCTVCKGLITYIAYFNHCRPIVVFLFTSCIPLWVYCYRL